MLRAPGLRGRAAIRPRPEQSNCAWVLPQFAFTNRPFPKVPQRVIIARISRRRPSCPLRRGSIRPHHAFCYLKLFKCRNHAGPTLEHLPTQQGNRRTVIPSVTPPWHTHEVIPVLAGARDRGAGTMSELLQVRRWWRARPYLASDPLRSHRFSVSRLPVGACRSRLPRRQGVRRLIQCERNMTRGVAASFPDVKATPCSRRHTSPTAAQYPAAGDRRLPQHARAGRVGVAIAVPDRRTIQRFQRRCPLSRSRASCCPSCSPCWTRCGMTRGSHRGGRSTTDGDD